MRPVATSQSRPAWASCHICISLAFFAGGTSSKNTPRDNSPTGLLLTFTASFDEFLFAFFLGGSQVTLPVFMWTQVRFPQTLPTVLALGALIFMVSVVLIGTAEWLRRMGGQHTNISAR